MGALIFLVYAVLFLFLAFASSGFEIGVATLNDVTRQQLDGLNPAIMAYIAHRLPFLLRFLVTSLRLALAKQGRLVSRHCSVPSP